LIDFPIRSITTHAKAAKNSNETVVQMRTKKAKRIAVGRLTIEESTSTNNPSWKIKVPGNQKNKFEAAVAAAQAEMTNGSAVNAVLWRLSKSRYNELPPRTRITPSMISHLRIFPDRKLIEKSLSLSPDR
jgi:hypothetical protein